MEKVLVTGASGFIAEHSIIELLKNGYSVKGSLRSMNREQEVRDAINNTSNSLLTYISASVVTNNIVITTGRRHRAKANPQTSASGHQSIRI